MNVMVTTNMGRSVWVTGFLSSLSALLTLLLRDFAGMLPPENLAQWLVYFLCFAGIWKCLGFVAWFGVLLVAPRSKLLDPLSR
jgi:hypothetical protein